MVQKGREWSTVLAIAPLGTKGRSFQPYIKGLDEQLFLLYLVYFRNRHFIFHSNKLMFPCSLIYLGRVTLVTSVYKERRAGEQEEGEKHRHDLLGRGDSLYLYNIFLLTSNVTHTICLEPLSKCEFVTEEMSRNN